MAAPTPDASLLFEPASTAPDPYRWLMLAGIGVSLLFWSRIARKDSRLLVIYFSGLCGAFLGAKLVYLAAEGWVFRDSPDRWLIWATGKSILGALLGGYGAVEFAKKSLDYPTSTGDWFAAFVPLGVGLGRVGCLLHGCCLGDQCEPAWYALPDATGAPRWPAVPLEIAFNLGAGLAFWSLRRRKLFVGQHFHLYLIAYGAFRFCHEFLRDTPKLLLGFSGYQIAALAVLILGAVRFYQRNEQTNTSGRQTSDA